MRYEVVQPIVPDEPPLGSVVLGKSGKAYQSIKCHNANGWLCIVNDQTLYHQGAIKWGHLVIEEAPLQVLYRTGESSE